MRGTRKCNKKWGVRGSLFLYDALKMLILALFENEQFLQKYSESKTLILSDMNTLWISRQLGDKPVKVQEIFRFESLFREI